MSENVHKRARELALASRIEEITAVDRRWLEDHMESCTECGGFSSALEDAVMAARIPQVAATTALVEATRRRVRARAAELQTQRAMMRPLWIAVAMVCAWATLTTPLVWAGFAWAGAALQLSRMEWRSLFVLAWMAPALAASLVLLGSGWRPHMVLGRMGETE